MSGKIHFRGHTERQNDRYPRNISIMKKTDPIFSTTVSNSLQYNNNDFPSLSEISEMSSRHSVPEIKCLKYSDKLKVPFQNPNIITSLPTKDSSPVKRFYVNKNNNEACSSRSNNYISKETQQNPENKRQQSRAINKGHRNFFCNNQTDFRNQTLKQNDLSTINFLNKSSLNSNNNNYDLSSYSDVDSPSNKSIKCNIMYDQSLKKRDETKTDMQESKMTKTNRKSKAKRTAAFQMGKITVLTPEVHSKILNQASSFNTRNVKSSITDINNDEEYPELGKSFISSRQKENMTKKENKEDQTVEEEKNMNVPENKIEVCQEEQTTPTKRYVSEKEEKTENKVVHVKDPITVTFFDMLMTKSPKTKMEESQETVTPTINSGLATKPKPKKGQCQAPNFLDSSCPVVKRGKERENPKPKKPSQLKKIILLDRKLRKEQLLKLCSSNKTGNEPTVCDNSFTKTEEISEELLKLNFSETSVNFEDLSVENAPSLSSNSEILISNLADEFKDEDYEKVSVNTLEDEAQDSQQIPIESIHSLEYRQNVLQSSGSLLKNLSDATISGELSEKEKTAKILLHTRNFREYCNHLVSKDIDEVVHALLDDLARFQDRMHQKDPVKARMKRRMIYGIKEVKKYIKLKKVKCVIIATDLENVETEGGLNDILKDIKSLAAIHNIPCVFALGRRALGKVCHKPVPVSCIGIFNAEGSETNFKKMVELLNQSKKDYAEMLRTLIAKLTEEDIAILLKARKEPETLYEIRITILRQYFLVSQNDEAKEESLNIEENPGDIE